MQKTLRKREVTLSRISVYIVVIIVTCHTIRWCLIGGLAKKTEVLIFFLPKYQLSSESTSALWWSLPVLSNHGLINVTSQHPTGYFTAKNMSVLVSSVIFTQLQSVSGLVRFPKTDIDIVWEGNSTVYIWSPLICQTLSPILVWNVSGCHSSWHC